MRHFERLAHVTLRNPIRRPVPESRDPVGPIAAETLYEALTHNDRPMQLDELFCAELLEQRVHRCVKKPALPLRIDARVIAFGNDLVDEGVLDPLHLIALPDPQRMFVLGSTNEALADKALFAAFHNRRHERAKGLPPTMEPREIRSRNLGDEVEVPRDFDRVKSVGRVDHSCLESRDLFRRRVRRELQAENDPEFVTVA